MFVIQVFHNMGYWYKTSRFFAANEAKAGLHSVQISFWKLLLGERHLALC